MLEVLLAENGVVLADLPLYPIHVLRQATDRCDMVLLVTRSDPASLMAARAALTLMERAGVDKDRVGIVFVGPVPEEELPRFDQKVLGSVPAEAGSDDPAYHAIADMLRSAAQPAPKGGPT